jgi:hypothetical protein
MYNDLSEELITHEVATRRRDFVSHQQAETIQAWMSVTIFGISLTWN